MVDSTAIKPEDVSKARDLIQAMLKAKKNLRLYPSNNPIYAKTIEDVHKRFDEFLGDFGDLDLKIGRNEIVFGNETVFQGTGKDDNLALLFFRDGLRELKFIHGLGRDEVTRFLEILSVDFDSEEVEDDIVTLLWESDFSSISYKVDEAVLVEDEEYEESATAQAQEGAMEEENVALAFNEALKADKSAPSTVMQPTEDDLMALRALMEKDDIDKKGKFVDILFDMLYISETIEEIKDLVRVMTSTIEYCIRDRDLATPVKLLGRVRELIDRASSDEVKKALNVVLSYAGTSNLLKVLGDELDSGAEFDEGVFNEYVGFLSLSSIPAWISLLGELNTMGARKYAINALTQLGKRDLNSVVKGLRDNRWFVVRNIVYILRRIGDKRGVEFVLRVAKHQDVRVRKEVLRALGELGGQAGMQAIREGLEDPDQSVRFAAIKALGASGNEVSKKLILDSIMDRRFFSIDFEEMKVYFEVLSQWKDEAVVDFLMGMLDKNSLFKRAKNNEMKAAAIFCLGLIGDKAFLEVLEKMRESKSSIISEHANAAIMRIRHGR